MFDTVSLEELDARGVLEFAADAKSRQLRGEADVAVAVGQWCDLHECGGCNDGQLLNPYRPGSERARTYGAEDNPELLEFCVAELAAVLGMHPNGAVELVGDVQDLRFRHPLLWARVQALGVPVWKARQIVRKTRHLSRELAQLVDARTVDPVTTLAWGRFLKLLDAAIIAVDPETAERLRQAAEHARFASMGRPDQTGSGLRTFTARTTTTAVVGFDAMCARIALMLKQLGDTDSLDLRRAKAFELLGHPVLALKLFADYQTALDTGQIPHTDRVDPYADDPTPDDPTPDGPTPDGPAPDDQRDLEADEVGGEAPITEADVHPWQNDADAVGDAASDADVPCPACAGAGTLDPRVAGDPTPFVKLATGLHKLDWATLLPKVMFYVHGSAADFRNPPGTRPGGSAAPAGSGVVRVEGHGPITVPQAQDFFGHDTHHISVRPVIDPTEVRAVDAYEIPDWMAEIVHLLSPGDIFPYAPHVGRTVDLDHLYAYLHPESGGPPGQTHTDNLGPMIRFHHRIKTHSRWRMRVVEPAVQLWRTPHGFYFQTDPRGTHPLTAQAGQLLWDACAPNPQTSGTGTIHTRDIPDIAAQARPPTRAPTPPSTIELEFYKILENHEYELQPE